MLVRSALAVALTALTASAASAAQAGHVLGFVRVALNPQPEPPGKSAPAASHGRGVADALVRVSLNPQPEPPGVVADARRILPPGPCSDVVVRVAVPGSAVVTTRATETATRGKCAYDAEVPGARPGAVAKVTFSRTP
ncbi:MAG: hypothetical protein NVS3B7_14220 [Candidatus Elarobacter sp.]